MLVGWKCASWSPADRRQDLDRLTRDVATRTEDLREPLLSRQPVAREQILLGDIVQQPLRDQFVPRTVTVRRIVRPPGTGVGCAAHWQPPRYSLESDLFARSL
jgi:hypothetical protein